MLELHVSKGRTLEMVLEDVRKTLKPKDNFTHSFFGAVTFAKDGETFDEVLLAIQTAGYEIVDVKPMPYDNGYSQVHIVILYK